MAEPIDVSEETSFVDTLSVMVRGLCMVIGAILLVVGLFCLIQVFLTIKEVIDDPATTKASVASISEQIDADHLVYSDGTNKLEFGKTVAFLLLFGWYGFWAWIPLSMLWVAGPIITRGITAGAARKSR